MEAVHLLHALVRTDSHGEGTLESFQPRGCGLHIRVVTWKDVQTERAVIESPCGSGFFSAGSFNGRNTIMLAPGGTHSHYRKLRMLRTN